MQLVMSIMQFQADLTDWCAWLTNWYIDFVLFLFCFLTLWCPLLPYGYSYNDPMPDRVKPSFVIFDIQALWRSSLDRQTLSLERQECLDVQNYKWRLNLVWHRMLYSCTHMATLGITHILRSLHWLKINERIDYKLLSLTYKVLTTSQPDYLHNLISVQSTGRTRSSSLVT